MSAASPGWYPDPFVPGQQRWWSGVVWTEHVDAAPRPVMPSAAPAIPAQPSPRLQTREAKRQSKDVARADRIAAAEARSTAAGKMDLSAYADNGPSAHELRAVEAQRKQVREAARAAQRQAALPKWVDVVAGGRVSGAEVVAINDHCLPGEQPWLVLGTSNAAGVLAAFEDRVMIIKTGLLTSFMAGTLGGGRITTFPFTDITGIEFNGQLITGVLEILTPSYQGTANKDYWRGTSSGRNSNSNDPFTLSNTLPLTKVEYREALPQLNELRRRIQEAKTPRRLTAAPSPGSLVDEIHRLAELHASGALSADEFAAAKQAVIARG